MRKTLLLTLIFASSLYAEAQDKIKFTYDPSGNRIKREIILSTKSGQTTESTFFTEELAERTIKIYPNPTKGQLVVEISDADNLQSASLVLFSMQGKAIAKMKVTSVKTDLDITDKPDGIYLLHITIDGQVSSWKIIKE